MHALIQNDTIVHIGPLPRIWWDGDRWHDLRDDDGTQAAALGWLPVTRTPRPDDTAATTWDRDEPALVDLSAGRALAAGGGADPRLAIQGLGEDARQGGLADAPVPVKR